MVVLEQINNSADVKKLNQTQLEVLAAELRQEMPRKGEIPFSSERKLMTTLHKTAEGKWLSVTKGAPDILLEKCSHCLDGSGQAAFTGGRKSSARMLNGEMAANALRVVAAASGNGTRNRKIFRRNIWRTIWYLQVWQA